MAHGRHSPSRVSDIPTECRANQSLQQYQSYLDASTPYTTYRWVGTGVLLFFFFLRIVFAQGWYIGTSCLNPAKRLQGRNWFQPIQRRKTGKGSQGYDKNEALTCHYNH